MKKRLLSLFLAFVTLLGILPTAALAANTEEEALGEVDIYNGGYELSYLTINGRIRTQDYTYFNYVDAKGQKKEVPAYCVNPNIKGVPQTVGVGESIKYLANERSSDPKVVGIISNGYPHRSLGELKLDNKYQAYYATKMALWCYLLPNWNIANLKVAPGLTGSELDIGNRILAAAKDIYKRGTTYNYMLEPRMTATPDKSAAYSVTVDGKQYKQQVFTIWSETWVYTRKGVLEYGGKFYVVGSGRQPLQKDKTQTEDYYLLTLAAIAMEMGFRGTNGMADIHLAAGLPLTSFGRDKKAFRDYLLRAGGPVTFRYEGESYTITVSDVSLFPQGYAAVLTQPELLDEPSVIVADIGGWTVDLMRLDRRIPNAATCRSLELGMIRCVDEIGEQVRRLFGLSLTAPQIESVLRGDSASMDERVRAVIHAQADKYVRGLLSAITESGLDVRAMPTVFLGGGAALMKRHGGAVEGLFRPFILDDVCLNAKGYERLVAQMSRGERRERDG